MNTKPIKPALAHALGGYRFTGLRANPELYAKRFDPTDAKYHAEFSIREEYREIIFGAFEELLNTMYNDRAIKRGMLAAAKEAGDKHAASKLEGEISLSISNTNEIKIICRRYAGIDEDDDPP